MSTAPTYGIGDRVRVVKGNGYDLVAGLEVIVAGFEVNDGVPYVSISGHPDVWDIDRFEKVPDAPEPEGTDDVEPEPLKEGDWVQVWAQVSRLRSDGDTECRFFYGVKHADGTPKNSFDERVRNDAIVRPDAGQVPPWVKPARCTSLLATGRTTLHRCEGEEGHGGNHVVGWVAWTDAEEYGRMVESGGAS